MRKCKASLSMIVWLSVVAWVVTPAHANKSGVSPGVLVLPSGPGSLGGIGENVQANLNMGLMSYQVKLEVPAGRGAATPNPSITYSSSAGAGIVGIGWDFSAGSSIMRGTVRGLPAYTNDDIMFAGGELVKVPGGPFYRSRYEGSFKRHRWVQKDASDQQGYWIVESPDGSKEYYGANSKGVLNLDAQIYGIKGTYCWKLVTMVDRNGNRVEYSYFKDSTQSYMESIAWVFDKSDKALYQLKFNYEERPDHISDGKPGFDLKTKKRLSEVRITSDGTRFRSYSLAYEDATGLSRLIKVTRYGRDATKAYPVEFTMKYSDAVFSPENSKMVTMPTSLGVDFRSGNIDFIDINGDGLPDVVDTSKPKHLFFINEVTLKDDIKQDGHDFPKGLIKENLKETSAQLSNPSIQMIDYNGDGFTDMVDAVNKKIYINKGNGQWEDSSTSLQNFPVTGKDPNLRFMDYNGDKKIDVISSDGSSTTFWVSDGKGNWVVTPGKTNIGLGFATDKLKLIDINGDGLQDIVHITKNSMRYRKYLGYGEWTEWIDVKVPGIDQYELSTQAQFDDINGDGMADMVAFLGNSIVYFVNKNGTEFEAGKKLETFKGVDIPDSSKMTIRIVDINGNGSRDIVWIDSSGRVTYLELFGKRPNLMTAISNGIGQRINVEYGSSVNFYLRDKTCTVGTDKACSGPWQNKMPMAFTVVTKITTWASRTAKPLDQAEPTAEERPQIQSIFYHNGFYDGMEKAFRGFRHVETLYDGDTSIDSRKDEIKFDVGDTDPYMHGKQLMQSISDGAEKTFRASVTTWSDCPVSLGGTEGKSLDPPIRFICMTAQETTHIEGEADKSKWKTTRAEYTHDGFGNEIVSVNLGEKDKDGDEKVTKTTYIAPSNPNDESALWLLRYPSKVEYCGSKSGPCSLSEFYYDGEAYKGLPLGQITKGNPTRTRQRVKGDKWIEPVRREYDQQGNLIGIMSANGLTRTAEWDDVYNRFPVKETIKGKDFSLTMSTRWDYSLSRVIQSTDLNGKVKRYAYDLFGRLISVFLSGDANDAPSIAYSYSLVPPLSSIVTETRSEKGKPFDLKFIQCFDGLGRKISQQKQIKEGVFLISSHTAYNRLGQAAQRWSPYEGDGTCSFKPSGSPSETAYSYDGLGRLLQVVHPNNDIERILYEPFKTIRYDVEDNKKDSPHYDTPSTKIVDGLGRVVEEITMPAKGKTIKKMFSYTNVNVNGAEQIDTVTLADGSKKIHEYDEIGNVTKIIDPDRTSVTFTFDDENHVLTRTDGRGITTVNTYDQLGRLLTRQQKDKPETKLSYQYDEPHSDFSAATHVKGRLVRVAFPGGALLQSYNERGDLIMVRRILMGHAFDFKNNYNNARQLIDVTLPDGRRLEYKRDAAGRIQALTGKIKSIEYLPNGLLKTIEFANGIVLSKTYDARFRLEKLDVGGGKVLTMEYKYDGIGNPTEIKQTHGEDSFSSTFSYDALYRLTKADIAGGKETLNYGHDDLHNMTQKTSSNGDKSPAHVGDYQYDKKQIHAATQAGSNKLVYDKAGHMTARNGTQFTWDFMGRMLTVTRGEQSLARFWYDDKGRCMIKEEDGLHVFYVNNAYEIRHGVIASYTKSKMEHLVASWTVKGVEAFFDDMDKDKAIQSNDAWLYHAHRAGIAKATVKERPIDLDLTKDMLASSAHRLLEGEKETNDYFHADNLGHVRAVTDDSGKVVQRKHYYPFGALRSVSGQKQLFSHGYQNMEWGNATEAWAFMNRSFDPKLGRWMSADPEFESIGGISDEFNSFGMTEGNPMAFRDVDGNKKLATLAYLVAIAVAPVSAFAFGYSATTLEGDTQTLGLIAGGAFAGIAILSTAIGVTINSPKKPSAPNAGNINANANARPGVSVDVQSRQQRNSVSSSKSIQIDGFVANQPVAPQQQGLPAPNIWNDPSFHKGGLPKIDANSGNAVLNGPLPPRRKSTVVAAGAGGPELQLEGRRRSSAGSIQIEGGAGEGGGGETGGAPKRKRSASKPKK